MAAISSRGLNIVQALQAYDAFTTTSCCTNYVIIQETRATTFAVVPKISCCCGRFFKRLCRSNNYYTKEQANKYMIAAAIKTFIDNNPAAITGQIIGALELLEPRFGDAAEPFRGLILTKQIAQGAEADRIIDALGAHLGLNPTPLPTPTAALTAPRVSVVPTSFTLPGADATTAIR